MINNQLLTHFNVVRAADDARALADWHNRLQELAASTRLGIPITLSTDPRNHFTENVGTAATAAASPNGPKHWVWLRLAPLSSWNALQTSLGRNTSRWVFAWPCIPKLTSLRSHAGLASAAVSARMQISPARWCRLTSADSRASS